MARLWSVETRSSSASRRVLRQKTRAFSGEAIQRGSSPSVSGQRAAAVPTSSRAFSSRSDKPPAFNHALKAGPSEARSRGRQAPQSAASSDARRSKGRSRRSFRSAAAASLKVVARMSWGRSTPRPRVPVFRTVSVKVLPEPALALTTRERPMREASSSRRSRIRPIPRLRFQPGGPRAGRRGPLVDSRCSVPRVWRGNPPGPSGWKGHGDPL